MFANVFYIFGNFSNDVVTSDVEHRQRHVIGQWNIILFSQDF